MKAAPCPYGQPGVLHFGHPLARGFGLVSRAVQGYITYSWSKLTALASKRWSIFPIPSDMVVDANMLRQRLDHIEVLDDFTHETSSSDAFAISRTRRSTV